MRFWREGFEDPNCVAPSKFRQSLRPSLPREFLFLQLHSTTLITKSSLQTVPPLFTPEDRIVERRKMTDEKEQLPHPPKFSETAASLVEGDANQDGFLDNPPESGALEEGNAYAVAGKHKLFGDDESESVDTLDFTLRHVDPSTEGW